VVKERTISEAPHGVLDETPVMRKDGKIFWMSISGGIITLSGKEVGFHTLHNIGKQVIAEQKLRESEGRYRMLFEHAGFGIALIDSENYRLTAMNNSFRESLGYSDEEVKGLTIFDIEAQETSDEVREHIDRIIKEGSDTFETRQITKSGIVKERLVSTVPLKIQGKYYIQNISSDITELKKTQRALKNASRDRNSILYEGGLLYG